MATWECPRCGMTADTSRPDGHVCDERTVESLSTDFLDEEFAAYMATPAGLFEQHYARRRA